MIDIRYNGKTIASLTDGQTATLFCKGKIMKTDVVVTVTESGIDISSADGEE